MNKDKFLNLNIENQIEYLNNKLADGQTVIRIREDLGLGEKSLQKIIKENGYKYNQKLRQYVSSNVIDTTIETVEIVTQDNIQKPSNMIYHNISQQDKIQDIFDLIEHKEDILKMLEVFKQNQTVIHCDTIDTTVLEGSSIQTSIRVNEKILKDFREYTSKSKYNSSELISIALLEFMQNHKL